MCHPVRGLGQSLRISRPNVFTLTSCGRINLGKKNFGGFPPNSTKNLVKNTRWLRHLVFFTRFFVSFVNEATSVFFASVDPATLGEYKLLDSYLLSVYV